MFPAEDETVNVPFHKLTPNDYLYDLVYNPALTVFLKKGQDQGAQIKNGLEMLKIQAEESWKIWNGHK